MPHVAPSAEAAIAVFDSGVGGLTVVSALRRELPAEDIVYLGDTARVPYGGKSRETIERYAAEIAHLLVSEGAKMIVVACNTASALAVPRLRDTCPVPVVGVIDPGVQAALDTTRSGHVAVIGTKATIGSAAYEHALRSARADIRVTSVACPLLVPLIEEGLLEDRITEAVLERYLSAVRGTDADTMVLGCTHYPLLAPAIALAAGPGIRLVDSAANCARSVAAILDRENLRTPRDGEGSLAISFTDPPDRFLGVAGSVLGLDTGKVSVRHVPPFGQ
ncbi:MAG: glutamate racemase [Chthoniobacterales bacterium]|nr:glutamate racemase [Chthoniobacterales bacterium]